MISPKNSFGVGDRWGAGELNADERGTPREYNADRLICQPPQRRPQFFRLKSEGSWFGLVRDVSLGVDQVKPIRPARVRLLGRVSELIDHRGNLDAQLSHASSSHHRTLLFVLRAGKNNFVFDVAFHLPNIAGMCFRDVHDQERDLGSVLLVKFIKGRNLPPEGRSRVATKNQHDGVALRGQLESCTVALLSSFISRNRARDRRRADCRHEPASITSQTGTARMGPDPAISP